MAFKAGLAFACALDLMLPWEAAAVSWVAMFPETSGTGWFNSCRSIEAWATFAVPLAVGSVL